MAAAYKRIKDGEFVLKASIEQTADAMAMAMTPFQEPDTFSEPPQWMWLYEDAKVTVKDVGGVSHLIIEKKDGMTDVSLGRLVAPADLLMLKNDLFIMTYDAGFDEVAGEEPVPLLELISIKIPAGRAPKEGKVAEISELSYRLLGKNNKLIAINSDFFAVSDLDAFTSDGIKGSLLSLYTSTLHLLSEVEITGGIVISLVPYGEAMLVSTLAKNSIKKHLWMYTEEDCYKPVPASGGGGGSA